MKVKKINEAEFAGKAMHGVWQKFAARVMAIPVGKMLVVKVKDLPGSGKKTGANAASIVQTSMARYFPGGRMAANGFGVRTLKSGDLAFCRWEDPKKNGRKGA